MQSGRYAECNVEGGRWDKGVFSGYAPRLARWSEDYFHYSYFRIQRSHSYGVLSQVLLMLPYLLGLLSLGRMWSAFCFLLSANQHMQKGFGENSRD